ncbi:hypothetical protein O6P43_001640 [Quillaja saponaria]|uniref:Uncharacterized protein n=1 Tax=Quillaja saponaria TaxID=32244 RepID=A0AAD7QJ89_QUISA|nr:hypothetical protein O6P43_001640 [Quillaja saponaria]
MLVAVFCTSISSFPPFSAFLPSKRELPWWAERVAVGVESGHLERMAAAYCYCFVRPCFPLRCWCFWPCGWEGFICWCGGLVWKFECYRELKGVY